MPISHKEFGSTYHFQEYLQQSGHVETSHHLESCSLESARYRVMDTCITCQQLIQKPEIISVSCILLLICVWYKCSLLYASNPSRQDLTVTAQSIAKLCIVVDKMHMAGHVDRWCKDDCDPREIEDLDEVSQDHLYLHL